MGFLFGQNNKSATVTAPTPVTRMPVLSDMNREAAATTRRKLSSRSGRSSTILTRRTGNEAGTTAYANSLLGQAG
jgi:hypothetical protein